MKKGAGLQRARKPSAPPPPHAQSLHSSLGCPTPRISFKWITALGFIQRSAARWSRTTSFAVTFARVELVVYTVYTTSFKLGASRRDCFTAFTKGARAMPPA